ncbi:biogenesis of lysosome- organelles complex 1 subunit 1, partial [Cichlidogyrus casuarinus]
AYINQRKLNSEIKTMSSQIVEYKNQVDQWFNLVNDFNNAIKELGDVQNWTTAMQRDMKIIHETLTNTQKSVTSAQQQ